MFWSILIVTLLLCSSLNACSVENPIQDGTILDKIVDGIESVVESKCLKNADANAFSELKSAINDFDDCLQQKIQPPSNPGEEITLICTQARHAGHKCMESVLEKLQPCLDLEERYLPNFLLNAYNATFDAACGTDDFMSILQSGQCNPNIEYMMRDVVLEGCLRKIQLIKDFVKPDYILRESNLCSALETAKDCIIDEVKLHCYDDSNLVAFLTTSFHHHISLCSGGDISVNLID